MIRLVITLVFLAALTTAVSSCGVKGALEPPPDDQDRREQKNR